MNPSPPRRLLRSMAALATQVAGRLEASCAARCNRLDAARDSLQSALGREIPVAECADMLSQAIVASLPIVTARKNLFAVAGPWLLNQAHPWERLVLEEVLSVTGTFPSEENARWLSAEDLDQGVGADSSVLRTPHLFEQFLAEHRRLHRKRGGVFYTPSQLVQFICRRVNQQLQEEFGLPRGLADATILDPAAGTGAFLLGAIDVIYAGIHQAVDWNEFVGSHLLPRLHGVEIIRPPALLLNSISR